ncbi:Uncharacterised protein [Mycobacteroides abscessus subsp. massiliense]|nr:Uncharacterised protein [Mycobacteroides abscessus subsp. massiliense]
MQVEANYVLPDQYAQPECSRKGERHCADNGARGDEAPRDDQHYDEDQGE